jgi:hypothetical protein
MLPMDELCHRRERHTSGINIMGCWWGSRRSGSGLDSTGQIWQLAPIIGGLPIG